MRKVKIKTLSILFFVCSSFLAKNSFSQTEYTLSYLDIKSITFQAKYDSIETKEVKILYVRQSNIVYQIMVSNKADYDSSQYSKDYDAF